MKNRVIRHRNDNDITGRNIMSYKYRKSLNTSRALNRGRASNTSRGSDLIVLIEAGPRIEAVP